MKFVTGDDVDLGGTHRQGFVDVSFDTLVKVFGNPREGVEGDKVAFEWSILFADGTVASVYDYKASSLYGEPDAPTPDEMRKSFTDWHIGGKTERAVELVIAALS
jgi:hypothetical protein